jgi:acyl carrier protein
MTEEEITAEIASQIRLLMPELMAPITPSTNFEELGMDSLSRVDLLAAAEREFEIEVPDESVSQLLRVCDLTELVLSMRPARAGAVE